MPNVPVVTQPGGTDVVTAEGPLRTGTVPRRIEWPFKKREFYLTALRTVSRVSRDKPNGADRVRVRHKTKALAGGHGVWATFARR